MMVSDREELLAFFDRMDRQLIKVFTPLFLFIIGLIAGIFLAISPVFGLEKLKNEEMAKVSGRAGIGFVFENFRLSTDESNDIDQAIGIVSGGSNLQLESFLWKGASSSTVDFVGQRPDDPFKLQIDGGNPSFVQLQFPTMTDSITASDVSFGLRVDGDLAGRVAFDDSILNPDIQMGVNNQHVQLGAQLTFSGDLGIDADANGDFGTGSGDLRINGLYAAREFSGDVNNAGDPPTRGEFFDVDGTFGNLGSGTACTNFSTQNCDLSDDQLRLASVSTDPLTGQEFPLNIDFIESGGTPQIILDRPDIGQELSLGAVGINELEMGNENFGSTTISEVLVNSFSLEGPL